MDNAEQVRLLRGIETMVANNYKSQKDHAKQHFLRRGGYEDVEGARANLPDSMTQEKWEDDVNYFTSEAHIRASTRNKGNRAMQSTKNHGGTASSSNEAYKKVN